MKALAIIFYQFFTNIHLPSAPYQVPFSYEVEDVLQYMDLNTN